jgi:hypothetical protein
VGERQQRCHLQMMTSAAQAVLSQIQYGVLSTHWNESCLIFSS